jgi:hypothetical protein
MDKISETKKKVIKPYHKITKLSFKENIFCINIDGDDISMDLKLLSPKLLKATTDERSKFIISPSGYGIHWPLIDEDISIDGLLKYQKHQKSNKRARRVT